MLERFDMKKEPQRIKWYLKPLTYLLSIGDVKKHKVQITKTDMEGIKPPYILLCNHNAFMDFKVATIALGKVHPNYVVAIDGFIGREGLLRSVGCICKRKFTNDIMLVKHLMSVVKMGSVPAIYPEARYSLCGTTAVLPESLGKLLKMLDVPVVTLMCHGHHVNAPFWNTADHKVKGLEAELALLFNQEDLRKYSVEEVNKLLAERFWYDDFAWAKEKGNIIKYPKRALGLHKVLYQCPKCGCEYEMTSTDLELKCNHCGATWEMQEDGSLSSKTGEVIFSHIPDWYEWERSNVRKEVLEGTYNSGRLRVKVMSLPNAKGFVDMGLGYLTHDMDGFKVILDKQMDDGPQEMIKPVSSLYSCHIEYEYLGKYGDLVDLNTLTDTWYIHPVEGKYAVTKMALATEELYLVDKLSKK